MTFKAAKKNNLIEVVCMVPGCQNKFRIPEFNHNSTISNNPDKQKCQFCKNREALSKKNIENNTKLLAQSGFFKNNKAKQTDGCKYPIKTDNAVKPKKGRKKTEKQLARDLADKWFSRYIRMKYSFERGGELFCNCYTCKTPHHILNIENGHWQRRGYLTTRLNADDCRPQCTRCNRYRSGEPEKFEINLVRELGQERVDELKVLAQQDFFNDNVLYWKEQAKIFRILTNELINQIGINPWKK